MYKVLLVDDERILLEGISTLVDWSSAGTTLVGTARNGIEACERIEELNPDIVISDVMMPGMDGLELVERINKSAPAIAFIILSGFGEFEYASKAMQYGVKHYLLKPTNETRIGQALSEVVDELRTRDRRDQFVHKIKYELESVIPHVKEHFLKEFVTNKTFGSSDWDNYRKLFQLEYDVQVRMILFALTGEFEYEHLFAVRNIAAELIETPLLSTTIGNHALLLVRHYENPGELQQKLQKVREIFCQYYRIDLTIALSEPDHITQARRMYQESLSCLSYRFYLGEGSLITRKDTMLVPQNVPFTFNEEQLSMAVKLGNVEEADTALAKFIEGLQDARLEMDVSKSYVIQQYVAIIRLCDDAEQMKAYYNQIPAMLELGTLLSIQQVLEKVVRELTSRNYEQHIRKHGAIVRKVIDIIHEQLGNPELSLNGVAGNMLYMNADYLGKLFKKETGEKFSNYVMKLRVQKAIEMLQSGEDVKIFELAEKLGFSNNPQYFSQVFKKITGRNPSDYL